ncbi:MAG: hypothetical protein KKH77_01215 [Candidatus Omnitrophica bacterium]|nr:hypothetical protein [Candidatus Omnitrophota bacterium]MBU0880897.1 hypothetical protein [Candidatus Omnitrophota bacterium]MBU1808589.1 hypothetical protein [Candidatus Omnitrophota bacterium]
MERLNHVIEVAKSSHQHMPALLSLLVGLSIIRRRSYFFGDDENLGDNFPVLLKEQIGR